MLHTEILMELACFVQCMLNKVTYSHRIVIDEKRIPSGINSECSLIYHIL